ncbi:MAG: hypothetical protein NTV30_03410, partial [Chloroflexi bacterium]|nr:hypothetical protein [Chloroflexota bacterium]
AKNNPEVKALISGREISVQTAKIPDATGNTLYKVTFVYNTIPSELRTMETNSAQTKGAYSSLSSDSSGSYDNANQYNYLVNAIVNTKTSEVINIEQEYVPVLNESQKQIAIDMAKAADPRIGNNTTLVDVDVKALPVTVTVTNQHIPSIVVVVSFKAGGKSYQVTVDLTAQKVISVK